VIKYPTQDRGLTSAAVYSCKPALTRSNVVGLLVVSWQESDHEATVPRESSRVPWRLPLTIFDPMVRFDGQRTSAAGQVKIA
jgi:hypothetical protein